jgi:hypothetical protein
MRERLGRERAGRPQPVRCHPQVGAQRHRPPVALDEDCPLGLQAVEGFQLTVRPADAEGRGEIGGAFDVVGGQRRREHTQVDEEALAQPALVVAAIDRLDRDREGKERTRLAAASGMDQDAGPVEAGFPSDPAVLLDPQAAADQGDPEGVMTPWPVPTTSGFA